MNERQLIEQAIRQRKSISFECKTSKAKGMRYGNPHALFNTTAKGNLSVDIFKTGGISTDPSAALPGWRYYKVEELENINILEDQPSFTIASTFNPKAARYAKALVMVEP